jgi:hypothetical protein
MKIYYVDSEIGINIRDRFPSSLNTPELNPFLRKSPNCNSKLGIPQLTRK